MPPAVETATSTASARPPSDNSGVVASGTPRRWTLDLLLFLMIVVVAFGVRAIYVVQLRASPWFNAHAMDPLFHHQWAEAFAQGRPFLDGPYFRAPLYAWFLGGIYWLFGAGDSLAPRLLQALLGSLNCGLLFLIGRRVFGRTAGVIAGLAAAAYWTFVYFDAELLSPVLIVFLNLLLLGTLLWTGGSRRPFAWLVAGVFLGLSAIVRPDILLFAPALVIWLATLHWRRWGRIVAYAACLTAGCLLVVLPVTVRNYLVGHDRVLIATNGGVNFYIGNNPGADGMSAVIPGDPPEWWPCYQAQVARAEAAEGRPLKASEVSSYYARQAWQYIAGHPGEALARMARKFMYFWSHWEIGNNQDLYFITNTYTPIARYLPVTFWIIGPLGFLGLLLSFGRPRELFPLWGLVLVYLVIVMLFFVNARYRVPAVALLILLGSYAACWLVRSARGRQWRRLVPAVLALAAALPVVARIPPDVDTVGAQGHRFAGNALIQAGRYAEAEQMLTSAVQREQAVRGAATADTWYGLGLALLGQNKLAQGIDCLRKALELNPQHLNARQNLAAALLNSGRYEEAIPQYQALLATQPDNAEVLVALGSALAITGRLDEGLPHLLRAVELEPATGPRLLVVAQLLRQQRRDADAIHLLRAAVQRMPNDVSLLVSLAATLTTCADTTLRDPAEALRLSEHAVASTNGRDAYALYAAAVAHDALGHADQAVEAARAALSVATQNNQTELIPQIQRLLQRHNVTP